MDCDGLEERAIEEAELIEWCAVEGVPGALA